MKKILCIIIFSLYLLSGFSQEHGYLLVSITDAEKTVALNEKGQLTNKDEKMDSYFRDFKVFSYKYAYPKAKNEYLRTFVSIECNCDVKELAEFLEENYSKPCVYLSNCHFLILVDGKPVLSLSKVDSDLY